MSFPHPCELLACGNCNVCFIIQQLFYLFIFIFLAIWAREEYTELCVFKYPKHLENYMLSPAQGKCFIFILRTTGEVILNDDGLCEQLLLKNCLLILERQCCPSQLKA